MAGRYRVSCPEARTVDGITFASKAEMKRYSELKLMERGGVVTDLELQPRFELQPAFVHRQYGMIAALHYVADFRYRENGALVVEDVKGDRTAVYKIKRRLFLRLFPEIDFREVSA